jgi:hypothetical protein
MIKKIDNLLPEDFVNAIEDSKKRINNNNQK